MPASITHAVAGEYVIKELFSQLAIDNKSSFYGGCILVDVHAFNNIDRRITHFVGTIEEEGENTFLRSCNHFLNEYKNLISCTWNCLNTSEKYFVAGYLCHLAVDECWRKLGWDIYKKLGLVSWSDFPFPGDIGLTTFDYMSNKLYIDKLEFIKAAEYIKIPNIFNHIPYGFLERQWNICKEYVISDGSVESYIELLLRAGKTIQQAEEVRSRYLVNWEKAIEFNKNIGGAKFFIKKAVNRSIEVLLKMENII